MTEYQEEAQDLNLLYEERFKELLEITREKYPKLPIWYAQMCIEVYLKEEFPADFEAPDLRPYIHRLNKEANSQPMPTVEEI